MENNRETKCEVLFDKELGIYELHIMYSFNDKQMIKKIYDLNKIKLEDALINWSNELVWHTKRFK